MAKKHYVQAIPKEEMTFEVREQRALTLLQFAQKAGKLSHGFEACKKNLLNGNAVLLLLTKDTSDNTRDKIMKTVEEWCPDMPVLSYGTMEELSAALGIPYSGIIAVLDKNFADKIVSYLSGNS